MKQRERTAEIMDDPALDSASHQQALAGLGRINLWSRSVSALWKPIAELAKRQAGAGRPLRVLDIACGGGDVARGLASRARSAGLPIEVVGADLSAQAVAIASEKARSHSIDVRFVCIDALVDPLPKDYDILTCTLFLHHLSETDATLLLGKMAASARKLVLVDDLIRSRLGFSLAWAGCRLLSRSKVVHHDGPISVAGAFQIAEIQRMAETAGLHGSNIKKHWPERFLLTWSPP